MATLIGDLTDNLNKQIDLYNDLLAIEIEKKNFIVVNDLDTLATMNTVENTIISKINRLDKKRLETVRDMCDVLSLDIKTFTLSNLCDALKMQEDKDAVLEIREKLNALMEELKKANNANKVLIEASLDYINFSLNAIKSIQEPMQTGYENDIKRHK